MGKTNESFQEVLPFPYLICFSQQEGVWELDVLFMVCLLKWFFCLLGRGSFHFVLCTHPFLGALI
jgi:hypothetical protein